VPAEQQRRLLFNAYRDFVERSCRMAPIVTVLEDLHWADDSTLQLLMHLAPVMARWPLLVIGTYRDVELDVTRPFAKVLETQESNEIVAMTVASIRTLQKRTGSSPINRQSKSGPEDENLKEVGV
jgi:predicted ATPase